MAKTKNKSDIKLNSKKRKTSSVKKNNVNINKTYKNSKVKKQSIKSEVKEVELVKKPKSIIPEDSINVSKNDDLTKRKERNRKKYENQQKKYQEVNKIKPKKRIVIDDEVVGKNKIESPKEETIVKKITKEKVETQEKEKEQERKEKRKFNRKSIHLTQTITNIKDKGVNKINLVKEKTDDKYIPIGKGREDKKRRFKRYVKEAIIYAVLLSLINVICAFAFDYFNFLRLFDVKALNIAITVIISLIFNFFITFMIDYFITEIWLKKRRKREDGVQDGDNRINEGEHQENIENKE